MHKLIRLGLGVVMGGLVASVAACAPTPDPAPETTPPSFETADATYAAVLDQVKSTLETEYPDVTWDVSPDVQTESQPCTYQTSMESDASLWQAAGKDWSTVMDLVNPVLTENGFSAIETEDSIAGGFTGMSSTDAAGATIDFADKNSTVVSVGVNLAGDGC